MTLKLKRSCVSIGVTIAALALGGCGDDESESAGEDDQAGTTGSQFEQPAPETPPEERYQALIAAGEPLKRVRSVSLGGLVTVRFRDREEAGTRYRVCFQNEVRKDCATRSTKSAGRFDDYPVTPELGRNLARWYVDGEEVARAVLNVEPETDESTEDAPTEAPDGSGSNGKQGCGNVTVGGGSFSVSASTYGSDPASPEPPSCSEAQAVVKQALGTGSPPSSWSCDNQTPKGRGDIVMECQRGASAGDIVQARTNDAVHGGPE